MASNQHKNLPAEQLVAMIKTLATERGEALDASDPKRANVLYKKLEGVYREIRKRGIDAQRRLLPLLDSQNVYVRLWVATCALEFEPALAVPVLQEIDRNSSPLVGFTAAMVLKEWREGKLQFA